MRPAARSDRDRGRRLTRGPAVAGAAAFAPVSPSLSLRGAQPARSVRSGASAVSMSAEDSRSLLISCARPIGITRDRAGASDFRASACADIWFALSPPLPRLMCFRACASSLSRRQALGASAAASLALFAESKAADAAGLATGYSLSEKDCNNQLAAYGLPQMEKASSETPLLIQPPSQKSQARGPVECDVGRGSDTRLRG